jgi:hypothetical protein
MGPNGTCKDQGVPFLANGVACAWLAGGSRHAYFGGTGIAAVARAMPQANAARSVSLAPDHENLPVNGDAQALCAARFGRRPRSARQHWSFWGIGGGIGGSAETPSA